MFKLLPVLVLLTLAVLRCKASDAEQLTLNTLSHMVTLSGKGKKCKPLQVARLLACLCFVASDRDVLTRPLKRMCASMFNKAPKNLRGRCSVFIEKRVLDSSKAISRARRVSKLCFVDRDELVIPPDADLGVVQILERAKQIKDLLEGLLRLLRPPDMVVFKPSAPARIVVDVGESNAKTSRLVAYNEIGSMYK